MLADSRFFAYFVAVSAGDAGYAVYSVSAPWLAYRIGGPVAVGLVLFVEFTIFSLSFVVGPLVDRLGDLRRTLVVAYLGQGALAAALALLAVGGGLTLTLLLALVIAISSVWTFAWSAANVALPRLVGPGEVLRANGLLGAVGGGNQLAGYGAGAGLLLAAGPGFGMFLYAALNGAAALGAAFVSAPRSAPADRSFFGAFRDGWAYFVGGPGRPRIQISLVSAIDSFATTAPVLLLTVLASRAGGAGAYALAFTAFALGTVVGGLLLGQAAPRRRLGLWLSGIAFAEGASLLVAVALWGSGGPNAAWWGVVGVADVGYYAILFSYFQATSPPALVGRTVANAYVFRGAARAAGGLVLGAAIALTAPVPVAVGSAAILAAAGVAALALPLVRGMRL